jgi:hypothetical protein
MALKNIFSQRPKQEHKGEYVSWQKSDIILSPKIKDEGNTQDFTVSLDLTYKFLEGKVYITHTLRVST